MHDHLTPLRHAAHEAAARSYAPFSGQGAGGAALLSDGAWVPGARLEGASFSLTISAAQAALCSAVSLGRRDVAALVLSREATAADRAFLAEHPLGPFQPHDEGFFKTGSAELPKPTGALPLVLDAATPASPEDGVALARRLAEERAFIPFSSYPVGCVLQLKDGRLVPGVNVEHPDWSRTLCGERSALCVALSLGVLPDDVAAAYLSCAHDAEGSPCGACRQLLAEHLPNVPFWMDRLDVAPPEATQPHKLLPRSFGGRAVLAPHA